MLCRWVMIAGCLVAACGTALAADDSLASLVGSDAALFVEVRQLDRHVTELSQSELAKRWQTSDLRSLFWKSPIDPIQKWRALDDHISKVTGAPFTGRLRELFGDSVALALYLPPQGEPQGVLIARATSPAAVDRVLKLWDRLEPPLRHEPRSSGRGRYVRRVFRREGAERSLFYAQQDRLFVLSDHEHLVRDCIERLAEASESARTLNATAEFREISASRPPNAWVTAYLNPRQWDRVLARDADESPPQLRLFAAWKTFRAVSAAVDTDGGIHAELTVLLEEGRTPSAWRDFAAPAPPPSILQAAPRDALAVLGARVRWPWLISEWERLLAADDREGFEKVRRVLHGLLMNQDVVTAVAPHVLGDWGVTVSARDDMENAAWWHWWNVTAISFLTPDVPAAVRIGVDNALLFAANAVAADRNGRAESAAWHVRQTNTPDRNERVLIGPLFLQPSYAWLPDRFAAANHPELLDQPTRPDDVAAAPAAIVAREFPQARVFAWLDLWRWQTAAARNPTDRNPLANVLGPLSQLGDQAFVAAGWTEAQVRLRAGLTVGTAE